MATEMVLVPKTRYEQLLVDDKDFTSKIDYYQTLLNNNNITHQHSLEKDVNNSANDISKGKTLSTEITTIAKPSDNVESDEKLAAVKLDESIESTPTHYVNKVPQPPIDKIIEQFPKKYKFYAKRLLGYISKNGLKTLTWDSRGVITYNGALLSNTNIVDIVKHVFKSIGTPPKGMKQFRAALKQIRVPKIFLKPFLLKPPGIPSEVKKNWIAY
jgi:hypothetical protein